MATASDDAQDHAGLHYSGPHAGCLTHEADLRATLAAAEARCAELQRERYEAQLRSAETKADLISMKAYAEEQERCRKMAERERDEARAANAERRDGSLVFHSQIHAALDRVDLSNHNEGVLHRIIRVVDREEAAESRAARYEAALREIQRGAGVFSLDPLEHASNCIEEMKETARAALAGGAEVTALSDARREAENALAFVDENFVCFPPVNTALRDALRALLAAAREAEEELRLTLIASHVHADEHRQQRDLAARYRYVIEREIVFYEEEAECGVSFYEGTFQQRAAALRAALAGQEVK